MREKGREGGKDKIKRKIKIIKKKRRGSFVALPSFCCV
jgi:hypothetical protein